MIKTWPLRLPLEKRPDGVHVAEVPTDVLSGAAWVLIAARTNAPMEALETRFSDSIKISRLATMALPGPEMWLSAFPSPPPQVPVGEGAVFFILHGWDCLGYVPVEIERPSLASAPPPQRVSHGIIAVQPDGSWPGLEMELWATGDADALWPTYDERVNLNRSWPIQIALHERRYGHRVCPIPSDILRQAASFVLTVRAAARPDYIRQEFPRMSKLGPMNQVVQLVAISHPGIRLSPLSGPPAALPRNARVVYFELERTSEFFTYIRANSTPLAVYVGGLWEQLSVQLWATAS